MRAVAIADDKSLYLRDEPKPEAAPGEVVIAVAYAGINRADLLQRRGFYPPPPGASPIMGLEVSGIVESGGARFKPGDRVVALLAGGGYADYVAAPEGSVLPLASGQTLEQAGATAEAAFTVWANVFEGGRLQPGETLLVHGGASGVGSFAIQMARAHGATVFATAGDEDKCALVERLGARPINYRTQDFEQIVGDAGGADVILDMVGGDYVQKNLSILRQGGRLVHIALMHGAKVTVDLMPVLRKHLVVTGSTLRARPIPEKARLAKEIERVVWPWIAEGKLKPVIDGVFPLEDADAAQARMASGKHAGKILLRMSSHAGD